MLYRADLRKPRNNKIIEWVERLEQVESEKYACVVLRISTNRWHDGKNSTELVWSYAEDQWLHQGGVYGANLRGWKDKGNANNDLGWSSVKRLLSAFNYGSR